MIKFLIKNGYIKEVWIHWALSYYKVKVEKKIEVTTIDHIFQREHYAIPLHFVSTQ